MSQHEPEQTEGDLATDSEGSEQNPEGGGFGIRLRLSGQLKRVWLVWWRWRLRKRQERLFRKLGDVAIDLRLLSSSTPQAVPEEVDELETKRSSIREELRDREERAETLKKQLVAPADDGDAEREELEKEKEELEKKLHLNRLSLERAQQQSDRLQGKLRRKKQVETVSDPASKRNQPGTVPRDNGLTGNGQEEELDDSEEDGKSTEQIEDDLERTKGNREELASKRDALQEELASIEKKLRTQAKGTRQQLNIQSDLQEVESSIQELENRLSEVDRKKKQFSEEIGRALFRKKAFEESLDRFYRRIERLEYRINRMNTMLSELRDQLPSVGVLELLILFLLCSVPGLIGAACIYFLLL